jgi:hypothetical protein
MVAGRFGIPCGCKFRGKSRHGPSGVFTGSDPKLFFLLHATRSMLLTFTRPLFPARLMSLFSRLCTCVFAVGFLPPSLPLSSLSFSPYIFPSLYLLYSLSLFSNFLYYLSLPASPLSLPLFLSLSLLYISFRIIAVSLLRVFNLRCSPHSWVL